MISAPLTIAGAAAGGIVGTVVAPTVIDSEKSPEVRKQQQQLRKRSVTTTPEVRKQEKHETEISNEEEMSIANHLTKRLQDKLNYINHYTVQQA